MEEFTSIAIWILITFLIVNTTAVWFSSSSAFQGTNFGLNQIEQDDSFGIAESITLRDAYYNQECASATPSDPQYPTCLIITISNGFNVAISLPGRLLGGLWNFAFAWHNLITAIFAGVPGGSLFSGLLIPFFTIIQVASIMVLVMKIAGIIRGGS